MASARIATPAKIGQRTKPSTSCQGLPRARVARTLPCEWALACVVFVGPRKTGQSGGTAIRALPSSVTDVVCLVSVVISWDLPLRERRHRHESTFLGHAGIDSNTGSRHQLLRRQHL